MTLFEALGGASTLRTLVDRFYQRMQDLPQFSALLALHPLDLDRPRERLYLYLIGWTGGPPLFVEAFGHPRLRARHLHVAIDSAGRDAWLDCMRGALDETVADAALREHLFGALAPLADHMRNIGDA